MTFKSLAVTAAVATAVVFATARTEARGFGNRGFSTRTGLGRSANTPRRYYGPSFSAAPRIGRSYGTSRSQMRPWYYYRSGPIEYYRPYRPGDRAR